VSPRTRAEAPRGPSQERLIDGIPEVWWGIADCESGDGPKAAGPPYRPDWDYHGRTYDGGLNFAYGTWDDAWSLAHREGIKGIGGAMTDAWRHTASEQVTVAARWLKATDWSQWPVCSRVVGVR